jgi:two-component system LytT family sensor kinase
LCPIVVGNLFFYFQQRARTYTRKITEQEYQLLHLEQLKTRAELEALQAKINPHFLYNALNSIASLVHDEPDRAERMVVLLSKLFRYTTGMKNRYFNTVADELEMVRTYLDVEQVRFGDRLTYRIDLMDPALKEVQIPQFLLQPLVENAIKHGISKVAGPGAIILRISEEEGWLNCRIHDNGPVFPEELVAGYGLQSIQDKLKLLYGNDARLLVENKPLKEVVVQIKKERLNSSPDAIRQSLSAEPRPIKA